MNNKTPSDLEKAKITKSSKEEIENSREILHQTALKAPLSSGVYLWRNAEDTVIYVGKAKNLKNRLSSYFSGQKNIKTKLFISQSYFSLFFIKLSAYGRKKEKEEKT